VTTGTRSTATPSSNPSLRHCPAMDGVRVVVRVLRLPTRGDEGLDNDRQVRMLARRRAGHGHGKIPAGVAVGRVSAGGAQAAATSTLHAGDSGRRDPVRKCEIRTLGPSLWHRSGRCRRLLPCGAGGIAVPARHARSPRQCRQRDDPPVHTRNVSAPTPEASRPAIPRQQACPHVTGPRRPAMTTSAEPSHVWPAVRWALGPTVADSAGIRAAAHPG
jgi:hypothetical protein